MSLLTKVIFNIAPLTIFIVSSFSTAKASPANAWECTYAASTTKVELDTGTLMMSVTSSDGSTDRGYAIERSAAGADYKEYFLNTGLGDATYDFRIWQNDRHGEFMYCLGCSVIACTPAR